jgi:guanylate kinase
MLEKRFDNLSNTDDTLILLVGESGTGKTSLANYLHDQYHLRVLPSYTTRPRRSDSKNDHTYVSDEEYQKLTNIVAENCYNGYMYCATEEQCDYYDIYVVDVTGLKMIKEQYHNKKIFAVYLDTPENTRVQRMKYRGDSDELILSRLKNDRKEFKEAKELCDVAVSNIHCLAMTAMAVVAKFHEFRNKTEEKRE